MNDEQHQQFQKELWEECHDPLEVDTLYETIELNELQAQMERNLKELENEESEQTLSQHTGGKNG